MLPDNGDSGGKLQRPSSLKKLMGKAPSMIGLYAHVRGDRDDEPFTGNELFDIGGSQTAGVRASWITWQTMRLEEPTASRYVADSHMC